MRRIVTISVLLLLAGCGGHTASTPVLPAALATGAPATAKDVGAMSVTLAIPAPSTQSSAARRPLYVSASTNGLGISYGTHPFTFPTVTTPTSAFNISGASPLCTTNGNGTRMCTLAITPPVGTDDFQVTAWDTAPSGGSFAGDNRLSSVTVDSQSIVEGHVNSLPFILNGAVDSIFLSLSPSSLPGEPTVANGGTNQTSTLSVDAKDHAGNIILANGSYTDANGNALTITVGQAVTVTGDTLQTSLSGTSITPEDSTLTVTYTGNSTDGTSFTATPSLTIAGANTGATLTVTPAITEFSTGLGSPSNPLGITSGPDGNLWFAESYGDKVGKITPKGVITEYPVPTTGAYPSAIAKGPDSKLWFTECEGSKIGSITTTGTITEFPTTTAGSTPVGITAGSDGRLWFTESAANQIGAITTLGTITEYSTGINGSAYPFYITAGSDNNLWFTESSSGSIGRITTTGTVTEFSNGILTTPEGHAAPIGITSGTDGDTSLWFTDSCNGRIGNMTTTGTVTEYSTGITGTLPRPYQIVGAPDGNLWFTECSAGRVASINKTTHAITEYSTGITPANNPYGITMGPDGNVWFTECLSGKIARLIY